MIIVSKQNNTLCVYGHANYGPHGKDIVCAGVSVLTYTLIESLELLTDIEIKFKDDEEKILIEWKALTKEAKVLLDAFFVGIKMLSDLYPEYISII